MSYYKMRGEMWQAAEVADWIRMMTEGAYKWLRNLKAGPYTPSGPSPVQGLPPSTFRRTVNTFFVGNVRWIVGYVRWGFIRAKNGSR